MADGSDVIAQNAIPWNPVTAEIVDRGLWLQFHKHGTEMIVTKEGRNLFPKLEYHISGMDLDKYYALCIYFNIVDNFRYSYRNGSWVEAGPGECVLTPKYIYHHNQPVRMGRDWMSGSVLFDKFKITNAPNSKTSTAQLQSMHKYIPALIIFQVESTGMNTLISLIQDKCTEFITVTAYQNPKIIDLKVQKNLFAKGSRSRTEYGKNEFEAAPSLNRINSTVKCLAANSMSSVSKPVAQPLPGSDRSNIEMGFELGSIPLLQPNLSTSNCWTVVQLIQLDGIVHQSGAKFYSPFMQNLLYQPPICTPYQMLIQNPFVTSPCPIFMNMQSNSDATNIDELHLC